MVTLEKKYFIGMRALKFCILNSCKPSQIPNIYGFIVIKISYCVADECRTQFSCLPVRVVVICFLSLLVALLCVSQPWLLRIAHSGQWCQPWHFLVLLEGHNASELQSCRV